MIRQFLTTYATNMYNARKNELVDKITNLTATSSNITAKVKTSTITFYKKGKEINKFIDAINEHICFNNNATQLGHTTNYLVTKKEEFEISQHVWCKVKLNGLEDVPDTNDLSYTIELFSFTLLLEDLRIFINDLVYRYQISLNNKLGTNKYFFSIHSPPVQSGHYTPLTPNLLFTLTKFETNKSLSNVFGEHLDVLKDRVNMFINNEEWYKNRGIPHTLGILLYGPPGTGKTSSIKAVANTTGRHIFNISLNKMTTKTQLHNLFYNDTIQVINTVAMKTETLTIPTCDRIYVFEDIDSLGEVFYEPEEVKKNDDDICLNSGQTSDSDIDDLYAHAKMGQGQGQGGGQGKDYQGPPNYNAYNALAESLKGGNFNFSDSRTKDPTKQTKMPTIKSPDEINIDPITTSFLLNLLDGILETPGRIIFFTTNHVEKLNKAIGRPGRIDLRIEVSYCNVNMIQDMYNFFFQTNKIFPVTSEKQLTPAMVVQTCMNNYNNPEKAYSELC